MAEWREVEAAGERIRYQEREGWTHPTNRYAVEFWHAGRLEWREVRNASSRDWFAIGVEVGRTMTEQQELAL